MKKNGQRAAEYYAAVGKKIISLGTVDQDEVKQIFSHVDDEQGLNPVVNVTCLFNKLKDVYGEHLEFVKIQRGEGPRGVGIKRTTKAYSFQKGLSTVDVENLANSYFRAQEEGLAAAKRLPRKGKHVREGLVATDLTQLDKAYRNAVIKNAREIRSSTPELSVTDSVRMARRAIPKINQKLVANVVKLLKASLKSVSWTIEYTDLKSIFQERVVINKKLLSDWCEAIRSYGIKLHITFADSKLDGRSWSVKVLNDPKRVLEELGKLNSDLKLGLTISSPTIKQNPEKVAKTMVASGTVELPTKIRRAIFYMAGLIIKNGGRAVSMTTISTHLMANHYEKVVLSQPELKELVGNFPQYFELSLGNRDNVLLAGNANDTWREIQQKFNPKDEIDAIPWYIGSGLDLEDIKEYFPESYVEGPENRGENTPQIVIVMANRGILSKMHLAILQGKMRKTDFPIGRKDLIPFLENELKVMNTRLREALVGKVIRKFNDNNESQAEREKVLLQIEEGIM